MGSSASKASRTAAGTAARKYPARATGAATTHQASQTASRPPLRTAPTEEVHTQGQRTTRASPVRSEAIEIDARDPHFQASLRKIGPVQPNPVHSSTSTSTSDTSHPGPTQQGPIYPSPASNPAIAILTARSRIQDEIEQEKIEAGRRDYPGRKYFDVATIRKALVLRDEQGMSPAEIEATLRLRKGSVAGLGGVGVIEAA